MRAHRREYRRKGRQRPSDYDGAHGKHHAWQQAGQIRAAISAAHGNAGDAGHDDRYEPGEQQRLRQARGYVGGKRNELLGRQRA
jgi:hypothetical protein